MSSPARPDWQTLWTLAWPAVLLNSLQTVNSLLDGFFVAQLEPAALSAMGASTATIFLFGSLTFTVGIASTALVSRFFGAQDQAQVKLSAQKCLSLSLYLGLVLAVLGLLAAPFLAGFFAPKGEEETRRLMVVYISLFALALPPLTYIQALAGALRGIGDTLSPMILSGIQIGIHILLNWMLIFPTHKIGSFELPGAGWGLAGAGSAMTISAAVAAIMYGIWAGRTALGVRFTFSLPGMEWTRRILNIAVPSGVLNLVRVTNLMAFTKILAETPQAAHALAGMRLGFSIESIAFMPAFGLGVAASALVGQSLGMKDPARANRLGWLAAHHAAVVSGVVSVLLISFAGPIAHALAPSQPEVAEETKRFLWFIFSTEIFFAYLVVLQSSMQGAGDSRTPMWLTIVTMWGIRVPVAAWLALGLKMGSSGAWIAMASTQLAGGILAMIVFRLGRWQRVQV